MSDISVLYLVFNRPDLVKQSFSRIRDLRPQRLFVAADGPRTDKENEAQICTKVREHIMDNIDWDCEVDTLFRDENLGCGPAVSGAIDWFFEHVTEGVILEDDCLVEPSFFKFCLDLLERYRDDKRVYQIAGSNWQQGRSRGRGDYYFSALSSVWGWATWRDRWQEYDFNFGSDSDWSKVEANLALAACSPEEAEYHMKCFRATKDGAINTWDYQWRFLLFLKQALSIVPQTNLVSNIGFDERGTHTSDTDHWRAGLSVEPLEFPLKHPRKVEQHRKADKFLSDNVWIPKAKKNSAKVSLLQRVKKRILD